MEIETFRVKEIEDVNLENILKLQKPEDMICRICFEAETDCNPLISPCKCNGSMKYVHEECLKIWLLASSQDIKESVCDICKSKFQMEIELIKTCSCKNFREECFKIFMFPLVISLIGTIFGVVIIYLVNGVNNGSLTDAEKIYFSIVIFACSVILVTLIYVYTKSIGSSCIVMSMKDWHIKSILIDETFEITHQTEMTKRDEGCVNHSPRNYSENNTAVVSVPITARYRGQNVVAPCINPLSLERINRNGGLSYVSRNNTSRSGNTVRVADFNDENNPETVLSERRPY